jgi:hypothetical protein
MMKTKSTIVDIKIAGAVAGKLVNAKVRREVERALEAYPDADQRVRPFSRSRVCDKRDNNSRP